MKSYRDLTEDEIRKIRNEIVTLGQKAIGQLELGGSRTSAIELMKKQRELKEIVENWEDWQKVKDLSFSDLI